MVIIGNMVTTACVLGIKSSPIDYSQQIYTSTVKVSWTWTHPGKARVTVALQCQAGHNMSIKKGVTSLVLRLSPSQLTHVTRLNFCTWKTVGGKGEEGGEHENKPLRGHEKLNVTVLFSGPSPTTFFELARKWSRQAATVCSKCNSSPYTGKHSYNLCSKCLWSP